MQKIILYRYERLDGGVTNSPVKPDCDYTVRYRLIADDGKILTNGNDTTYCADVNSADGWTEIEIELELEKPLNIWLE